jgi:hypothetical protein
MEKQKTSKELLLRLDSLNFIKTTNKKGGKSYRGNTSSWSDQSEGDIRALSIGELLCTTYILIFKTTK